MFELNDIFGGAGKKENPELDKVYSSTHSKLEELKSAPEASNIASSLLEAGLVGLRADLDELGIEDSIQVSLYESQFREAFQRHTESFASGVALESFEAQNLSQFVESYASYSKLDAIIEETKRLNKDPLMAMAVGLKRDKPELAAMLATVFGLMRDSKKEDEKSPFDKKLDELLAFMSGEEGDVESEPGPPVDPTTVPPEAEGNEATQSQSTEEASEFEISKKAYAEALNGMNSDPKVDLLMNLFNKDVAPFDSIEPKNQVARRAALREYWARQLGVGNRLEKLESSGFALKNGLNQVNYSIQSKNGEFKLIQEEAGRAQKFNGDLSDLKKVFTALEEKRDAEQMSGTK